MKLKIPKSIEHNGELFKLHKITPKKSHALRLQKKLTLKRKHTRIKYFDNNFAIYKRWTIWERLFQ